VTPETGKSAPNPTDSSTGVAESGPNPLNDDALLALWLAQRPRATRRIYGWAAKRLRAALPGPLASAKLSDLQKALADFDGLAPRSRALAVAATRSLFSFLARAGVIPADPSSALIDVKVPEDLAERILTEAEVEWLITSGGKNRVRALLRLLYTAGLRVSEATGLCWHDLVGRGEAGAQITVIGKGAKARSILIPGALHRELVDLKVAGSKPGDRIFDITAGQIAYIAKRAARAAGLSPRISPHWLRHAHASHSLNNGAPLSLVRDTLGHSSVGVTDRYLHARPRDSSAHFLRKGKDR
jgi:integrase/recombinase XerD